MTGNEWSLIVRQHTPLVWKTVYRLLANHADASDCFQDTFVSAWDVVRRQRVNNWPGLLQHLATQRALDQLRRRRQSRKHVSDLSRISEIAATDDDPLSAAQSAELAGQLRLALAELPGQQSQVYCLRHLNGFSYEQIADELRISPSNVGVILHRATQRLRAILAPVMRVQPEVNHDG